MALMEIKEQEIKEIAALIMEREEITVLEVAQELNINEEEALRRLRVLCQSQYVRESFHDNKVIFTCKDA